jgi:hypothetical protein
MLADEFLGQTLIVGAVGSTGAVKRIDIRHRGLTANDHRNDHGLRFIVCATSGPAPFAMKDLPHDRRPRARFMNGPLLQKAWKPWPSL